MNSKKKIIGSIIAVLCICVMVVFVFPSPNAYLLKADVSGEKKTGYSLYKSTSISSKINSLEFIELGYIKWQMKLIFTENQDWQN